MTFSLFPETFEFCSLASGSSGNSYYFGNGQEGFLVDAGINGQHLKRTLHQLGIAMEQIKGVVITHDHIDHMRALNALTRLYRIPIFATSLTWRGILNNRFTGNIDYACHEIIEPGQAITLAGFTIHGFSVSHDASDPMGFFIEKDGKSVCLATDIGCVSTAVAEKMKKAQSWILEANYDLEMLLNGRYTKELKNRIQSNTGHLNNHDAAAFIAAHYQKGVRHILLCHLSKENNTPELVLQAVNDAMEKQGKSFDQYTQLLALPRTHPSTLFTL